MRPNLFSSSALVQTHHYLHDHIHLFQRVRQVIRGVQVDWGHAAGCHSVLEAKSNLTSFADSNSFIGAVSSTSVSSNLAIRQFWSLYKKIGLFLLSSLVMTLCTAALTYMCMSTGASFTFICMISKTNLIMPKCKQHPNCAHGLEI